MSQIAAKGKLAGQEINQLAENGIPAVSILSQALGKPKDQIIEMSRQGQISFDLLIAAMHQVVQENGIGDAMEKQSHTFSGATENIKDSLLQLANRAFTPLFKRVSHIADDFAQIVSRQNADFGDIGKGIGKAISDGMGAAIAVGAGGIKAELAREFSKILNGDFSEVSTPQSFGGDVADAALKQSNKVSPMEYINRVTMHWQGGTTQMEDEEKRQKRLSESAPAFFNSLKQGNLLEGITGRAMPKIGEITAAVTNLSEEVKKVPSLDSMLLPGKAKKVKTPKMPNPEADFRRENRVKTGNAQWDKWVYEYSQKYGVDSDLIFAQMMQESSFNPKAVSPKGAGSLMQVMPGTFTGIRAKAAKEGIKIGANRFDPRTSIEAGIYYMRDQLATFSGNTSLALAAYNAGPGAVIKAGNAIPRFKETQDYVKRIQANYGKVKGRPEFSGTFDYQKDVAEISDSRTKDFRDQKTMAAIDGANLLKIMPDPDVIRDYNNLLVEQAKKTGDIQPELEETIAKFKNFAEAGTVSDQIVTQPLDRRSQRFLDTDESLGITKRRKELDERRLYLADEILAKENDYILTLQEAQTDLTVEAELLKKRNLSFETANEFSRQLNNQTKELGDIEVALGVLHRQNADDQFVAQRRLLSAKREQIGLEQDISDLQDKLATQGVNNATRYRAAQLKAIYDVREADTRAVESQIESQVRIADAGSVHVEQIRADVLDALASQKTMSQTIADEIVGLYDKIGEASDKFLDKTVGKIPIIGGIAKTLARSALTKITSGLLDTFLPGGAEALQSSGNPLLDENKQQTRSLKNIEKVVTSLPGGGLTGGVSSAGLGTSSVGNGGGVLNNPNIIKNIVGGGGGSYGNRTGDVVGDISQVFAGDKGRGDLWSNVKYLFGKKDGSLLGKNSPIFGKDGFGSNVGTFGAVGAGAGILGGLVGGKFGGLLSGAGSGLAIGAQLGSIIPGIGTAVGAIAGAAIGGLIGLISGGGQRKKDEKTRNQGMLDALSQIDKLIESVRTARDFTDAAGVISQGATIKQSYLDTANGLKDKKTRNIALKDVSRIDEKLRQLETLAKTKAGETKSRAEALALDVPTFADGGSVSDFMSKNFRNNPLGYVQGAGTARSDSINAFFPQAKTFARISNGEYVLDAETTKNLGVDRLNAIRAGKGKDLANLKYLRMPNSYADGGAISSTSIGSPAQSSGASSSGGIKVDVNANLIWNEAENSGKLVAEVVVKDQSGENWVIETVEKEIYRGGKDSKTYKAHSNISKGNR